MAAKGYCTADDVANFLGLTLTAAQESHCNDLIEQAEIYIDNETGRGWLVGAQADEAHFLDDSNLTRRVYLRYAPVTSVDAVTGRYFLGDTESTLTVDDDYEVRDLASGLVYVVTSGWQRLLVDYTPTASVPADIKRACAELVSAWMQPHLQAGSYGIDSYSLPDLTVKFSRSHVQASAPPGVQRILDYYRYPVHA